MQYSITITTGRAKGFRDRTYIFKTKQALALEYFTNRRSLNEFSYPRYIEGIVEDYTDSSGGEREWKDFNDFDELRAQNIFSIYVNNVDINQEIIDAAARVDAEVKFPLI